MIAQRDVRATCAPTAHPGLKFDFGTFIAVKVFWMNEPTSSRLLSGFLSFPPPFTLRSVAESAAGMVSSMDEHTGGRNWLKRCVCGTHE